MSYWVKVKATRGRRTYSWVLGPYRWRWHAQLIARTARLWSSPFWKFENKVEP